MVVEEQDAGLLCQLWNIGSWSRWIFALGSSGALLMSLECIHNGTETLMNICITHIISAISISHEYLQYLHCNFTLFLILPSKLVYYEDNQGKVGVQGKSSSAKELFLSLEKELSPKRMSHWSWSAAARHTSTFIKSTSPSMQSFSGLVSQPLLIYE